MSDTPNERTWRLLVSQPQEMGDVEWRGESLDFIEGHDGITFYATRGREWPPDLLDPPPNRRKVVTALKDALSYHARGGNRPMVTECLDRALRLQDKASRDKEPPWP